MTDHTIANLNRNHIGEEVTLETNHFTGFTATIEDMGPSPRINGYVADLTTEDGEYQVYETDDGELHLFIESEGLPYIGEVTGFSIENAPSPGTEQEIPFLTA